jgi:tRNA A-37 threonylcarbamoyl transferase component Bud32
MNLKEYKIFNNDLSKDDRISLANVIHNFDLIEGGFGKRNFIKQVFVNGEEWNIKSFKIPNLVNKIAYKYFRKSKARRSFEYANTLLKSGVNTPKPIAFFEYSSSFMLYKSFYVSEQFHYDLTYRELIHDHGYPEFEKILRAFTRFTFNLHENGINFLDHSPGNTLIKKNNNSGEYDFYLVDLNRMKFHSMDFEERMKNFAKLSPKDVMLDIMSDEYAKLYPYKTKEEITKVMYFYSNKFSTYYVRQEQFKKKYYFWRK